MQRRIYYVIVLTVLLCVTLFGAAASMVSYGFYKDSAEEELRAVADTITRSDYTPEEIQAILNDNSDSISYHIRLTAIATDGTVLYDSDSDAATLENHSDRAEVVEALNNGSGEALRFSKTLGQTTYYYAKLYHGNVIRFSREMSSIFSMFEKLLPVLVLIGIATVLTAAASSALLSKRMIKPVTDLIGQIEITDNPNDRRYVRVPGKYAELKPIAEAVNSLSRRAATQLAQLRRERDTIGLITRNMVEGLILLDETNTVLSVNDSALTMLGVGKRSYTGGNLLELTRIPKLIEAAEKAKSQGGAEITLHTDGRVVRAFVSRTDFADADGFGLLILLVDVTQSARNEEIRRDFSANVSHELKTPLTTIKGFGEMLESGILTAPADIEKYGGTIYRESARMLLLINDIIRLTEIEESESTEITQADLLRIAEDTCESLSENAAQFGVTLTAGGESAVINGSATYLSEIVFNLADNAVKYNHPGGTVRVTVKNEPDSVVLAVADTGIGIPKEDQSRIFERFYRVDKSRSRKTAGTGLGLSIVKHAVQFHHGTIALVSEPGTGTTITVTLPKES
ncbi:MAG: ATP-binding protein [Oscillospiraceae bacterium]